ncbi:MAG: DUF4105 domain-containing protein [Treponema sp.]|nr:DUF4105 domain-containing protein [Treponema sp.]
MTKKIAFIILFILFGVLLFAQETDGENLTIKIAVAGAGTELYFWWGHIALVIEDSDTGRNYFYDYGLFSFDSENFYANFAMGLMMYSCGASSAEASIATFKRRNRSVVYYTLDLPPETKVKIRDFVEENILPQNRDYRYHLFRDNCSTRIRDIIDYATDGQFKDEYGDLDGRFTLRDHVRRHTYFSPFADWFLNFLMGQVIDTPIKVWDDMFIPAEVGRLIQEFSYNDVNGVTRKLVSSPESIEVIFESSGRPDVLDIPRKQWPMQLAFSLVLCAIFGLFFYIYSKNIRAGRTLAGISMSLCGLVFGLSGLLLYFMAIFTDHDYTYQNLNMIFSSPILLAAVPIGIGYAAAKNSKIIVYDFLSRIIWLFTAAAVLVSMLLNLLPWFYQKNLPEQLLMLPFSILLAFQPVGLQAIIDKYFKKKTSNKER